VIETRIEKRVVVSGDAEDIDHDKVYTARKFLSCDAMLVRYMLWLYVWPSLCLSQVRVLPKRLNVGSRKQRYTIALRL